MSEHLRAGHCGGTIINRVRWAKKIAMCFYNVTSFKQRYVLSAAHCFCGKYGKCVANNGKAVGRLRSGHIKYGGSTIRSRYWWKIFLFLPNCCYAKHAIHFVCCLVSTRRLSTEWTLLLPDTWAVMIERLWRFKSIFIVFGQKHCVLFCCLQLN